MIITSPTNDDVLKICKHTRLRLAQVNDAQFLLSLRLNSTLNKHLSSIEDDVNKQEDWLRSYKIREARGEEFYFIISSENNVSLGSVRLYDFKSDSFCWGSLIVIPDAPIHTAIESAISVYELAFYTLGFQRCHFDVRKNNYKVIKFHEGFGAKKIRSDNDNYYFEFQIGDYQNIKTKYRRFFSRC